MKMIVVCNPGCGKQNAAKYRKIIIDTLSKDNDLKYVESKDLNDFKNLVTDACKEYECIVVSGGDGTFHHAINCLDQFHGVFGYIPRGTSCDMGRNLYSSKKIKKALKVILDNCNRDYRFLKINDEKIAYVIASGKFVATSYSTSRRTKRLGKFAYLFKCIPEIFKHYRLSAIIDGKKHTGRIMVIVNTRSIFGCTFKFEQNQLVIIKRHPLWAMFWVLVKRKFTNSHCMEIIPLEGKTVEYDFNTWSVDGEKMELPSKFEVKTTKENFKVIMGNKSC